MTTDGDQAQSLTSLDTTGMDIQMLTASFSPGQDLVPLVEGEAHPTCAAALADAVGQSEAKVFQINRAWIDAPLQEELIYALDGRLFIRNCRLRDRTGGSDVDVVRNAVPLLYGCADEAEVKQQLEAQSLTSVKMRVNARGVIRVENGVTKKYIVKVDQSALDAVVSMSAMRMTLGLSSVSDDVVMPAPADRILDEPMLGLALKRDEAQPLGAFRVLLLVQGTQETKMDVIDGNLPPEKQTFKMISQKVRYLLSASPTFVELVAYCSFQQTLEYRLAKETALVLVSAVEHLKPGSASLGSSNGSTSGAERTILTVEHMQKISKDERNALERSMAVEWKSVLTTINDDQLSLPKRASSTDSEYWESPATKLRRIQSEPGTPTK